VYVTVQLKQARVGKVDASAGDPLQRITSHDKVVRGDEEIR
jgi:hypothetical protein